MEKVKAFFASGKVRKGLVISGVVVLAIAILVNAAKVIKGEDEVDLWEEVEAALEEESA